MDVQKYLDRISFKGTVEVSLQCLTKLQNAHQINVPFENLDNWTGRKKVLDHKDLYEHIVDKNRGGWCHELNGSFSWLLAQLGFNVKIVSAQYYDNEKKEFCKPFDHMTLIVDIGGNNYLTDVGFGNIQQPFDPIRLTEGSLHHQVGGMYKIIKENGWWVIQQKMRDVVGHHKVEMNRIVMEDVFTTMYRFDEVSRNISDFQERCDEYQTDVDNVLLAALPVVINKSELGEVVNTLVGARFTRVRFQDNADIRVNQLDISTETYNTVLSNTFGIHFPTGVDIQKIMQQKKIKESY